MNRKVLKTMIALVVIFLCALYILKIFFPHEFVMAIETEQLITVGNYIDNHIWAKCLVGIAIGIIFDYLYFGAVCQMLKLKWYIIIIIFIYNVSYSLFVYLAPSDIVNECSNLLLSLSTIYMILLPVLFTKKLLPLSITYSINYMSQALSLSIRDIGLLMLNTNSLTMIIMSLECYFWVALCYMLFNYKKEDKANGTL